MKSFLLKVDVSNGILSESIANEEIEYYIQNSSDIKSGDAIVGYIGQPINRIQMVFLATKDSDGDNCYLKKILDFNDGIEPESVEGAVDAIDTIDSSSKDFIEIEGELYQNICAAMVKAIGSFFEINDDEEDDEQDDGQDDGDENSLKARFRKYILEVRHLKSDRQVRDLAKLSKMMVEAGVISKDVYSISEVDEYVEIRNKIKNSDIYKTEKEKKKDKSPNSGLPSDQGLTNYEFFLKYLSSILNCKTNIFPQDPRNKIYFGAPGTGKSHKLEEDWVKIFNNNKDAAEEHYERVTFYQDYSYANFVGSYKPTKDDNGEITYEFVPGPFISTYIKAIRNAQGNGPYEPYLLLIEEINRAQAAAVFGDMFQLLDRNAERISAYKVNTSVDLKKYLAKELNMEPEVFNNIRIPDNMFIWATMNSADQGVFPIDTAFKRRWEFEYLSINNNETEIVDYYFELKNGEKYLWNDLRKAINSKLAELKINEDKMMGAFFLPKWVMGCDDNEAKLKAIKDKVIMYLFEDAAKQKRSQIFTEDEGAVLYSDLCERFDGKDGLNIFSDDIVKKVAKLSPKKESNDGLIDKTEEKDSSMIDNSNDIDSESTEE